MRVGEFNALAASDAEAVVASCADVPAWAHAVAGARPFESAAALVAHADGLAARWTDAEVAAALADHPRIGERHAGSGASATHSRAEQAGVDPHDVDVAQRLADANARYEQTFDRIFLVRAAGRSAEDVLALLEQRLTHDAATEAVVTAGELREIAVLRLSGTVEA